jgi:hypothetical protein
MMMMQNVKIISQRMSLTGHITCMWEIRYTYKILAAKPKRRHCSQEPGIT